MKDKKSISEFSLNAINENQSTILGGLRKKLEAEECGVTTLTYVYDENFNYKLAGDWIDDGCC